jgi:hypothetical protein
MGPSGSVLSRNSRVLSPTGKKAVFTRWSGTSSR